METKFVDDLIPYLPNYNQDREFQINQVMIDSAKKIAYNTNNINKTEVKDLLQKINDGSYLVFKKKNLFLLEQLA